MVRPQQQHSYKRRQGRAITAVLVATFVAATLFPVAGKAGTTGTDMPWNGPLQAVLGNLTGPTGQTLAALMFVVGGAVWGFTRHEEGARRFGQAIFGIAVMLGAVQIVGALAFSGAVV